MGTTPKDTAPDDAATDEPTTDETTADAPPADDAPPEDAPPADDAPAADPPADDEKAADGGEPETADAANLQATIQGNLIILSGTAFEPGTRYDVRFQRPDGSIDNTIARAGDDGALTTYATVRATGKHLAWLEKAGEKVAQLKFKV